MIVSGLLISQGLNQVGDSRVTGQFFNKSSDSSWILLSSPGGVSVTASHGLLPHTGKGRRQN